MGEKIRLTYDLRLLGGRPPTLPTQWLHAWIMKSKAAALDTFLKSLQDREINVEDVAQIKEFRDILKAKYAKV